MISTTGTATERQLDSTDVKVAGMAVLTITCWFPRGALVVSAVIADFSPGTSSPVIRDVASRSSTTAVPCCSGGPSSIVAREVNIASKVDAVGFLAEGVGK